MPSSYTFHTNLYDAAFFGLIIIGLTFALQLWFKKGTNRSANQFLAMALGVTVLGMAGLLSTDSKLWTLPQFSLAFGPLLYFYVRKTIRPESKFHWKDLLHFTPVLLESAIWVPGIAFALKPLTFMSVGVYLYLSHGLIKRFYSGQKFNEGDRYRHKWRWLDRLLAGMGLSLLLWVPLTAIDYLGFHFTLGRPAYYPLYLLMAVMVIRMGIVVFFRSGAPESMDESQFPKSPVPVALKQKGTWLRERIEAGLYYRDPELNVSSLAEKLGLHSRDLSHIINGALGKSFNDFVNEYRVRDVARKMQDPAYDHMTLLGMAWEAGFNSKSTFNRIFKQMTGKSPAEYKRTLKKEFPSRDLGRYLKFVPVVLIHETTPMWGLKKSKHNFMFRNYLKIAWRNLQKQKGLAFINVSGLSVGIACVCLLLLFITNEFSFDKFHQNARDIYRVYAVWDASAWGVKDPKEIDYTEYSSFKKQTLAAAMKEELPDVVNYVQIQLPWGQNLVRANHKVLHAEVGFADQAFFSVFNFPLKYGNKATALHNMNDIVLTSSRAKTLFGTDDVIGKTVEIQLGPTTYPFIISAVTEDVPANSSIRFEILGNFSFTDVHNPDSFIIGSNWHPTVRQTYVQLKPGSKLAGDRTAMNRFLNSFTPPGMFKQMGLTNWKKAEPPVTLKLQPLLHIHTDSWFNGYAFTDYEVINLKAIWILMGIAGGILLIACINFTTLAIGRSAGRSKEVGVRKVIGAGKREIILQFLAEALMMSFISTILGLIIAYLLLPWFNQLSGRELGFSLNLYAQIIVALIGLVLVVGLLAGSYPALVLSNFKPVEILKSKLKIGGANLFTKSLVTFQFALSIILIISTVIILKQTNYLINKDPGFNKQNVVAIDASEMDPNKIFPSFKQALLNHPGIVGITSAAAGLGAGQDLLGYSDQGLSAAVNIIDPDYLKVFGMHLIAGRNFDPVVAGDTVKRVIINETMMRAFGWTTQNAIGQEIKHFQGTTAHVIGVVQNFYYRPLSEEIKNQLFETTADKGFTHFYVRITAGNSTSALAAIKKAWESAAPGVPLKYSFLDNDLDNYYRSEQRWSGIVGWAGGISIFLACLGLLGLAALAAINRIKEIGIRKVLGASVINITNLMLKDFLKLILISFMIASPLAWYFMHNWLQDYANRINISWTVFVLAGVFTVTVALITICFQAIKAALANPVKSLRSE